MSNKVLIDKKDLIIKKYQDGEYIEDIARHFGVHYTTIQRRLNNWGIKVMRKKVYRKRKSNYNMKAREFSPELKAKMAENTRINNAKIKYINFYNTTEDQILITNILSRPIIG